MMTAGKLLLTTVSATPASRGSMSKYHADNVEVKETGAKLLYS